MKSFGKSRVRDNFNLLNKKSIPVNVYDVSNYNDDTINLFLGEIMMILNNANPIEQLLKNCLNDIIQGTQELDSQSSGLIETVSQQFANHHYAKPNVSIYDMPNVMIVGDIHGDSHTMKNILYHILDSNGGKLGLKYNACFTGDYVDRGVHSLQCFLIVLCLKLMFPNEIIVLRGNHDDIYFWLMSLYRAYIAYEKNSIKHTNCVTVINLFQNMFKSETLTRGKFETIFSVCAGKIIEMIKVVNENCNQMHTCNMWNCETHCYTMFGSIYKYSCVNSQPDVIKRKFINTMLVLFDAVLSMEVATVININNDNYGMKIYCAHGGMPLEFMKYGNKGQIYSAQDLIDIYNAQPRLIGCVNSTHLICRTLWLDQKDGDIIDDKHNDLYEQAPLSQLESPLGRRSNSLLHEDISMQYVTGNAREQQDEHQTTRLCIKFGIDLMVRGHEIKYNGFEFTHARVLTNHSRPTLHENNYNSNGAFCLIDREGIEILTIKHGNIKKKDKEFALWKNIL